MSAVRSASEDSRAAGRRLLHAARVGTWVFDPDREIYTFSAEIGRWPGLERRDGARAVGTAALGVMEALCHPDDLAMVREIRVRITTQGGADEFELRLGDPRRTGWRYNKVLVEAGRRLPSGKFEMLGLTQNVTPLACARDEARTSAQRVQTLASTDALTGLANRLTFDARLRAGVASARRGTAFALLFLDLDRFKEVNDTLGHQAGDQLIQIAAQRLSALCREGDTVARLGGDEFAVIQIGADARGAARLAERAVQQLRDRVDLGVGWATLSCSLGATVVGPEDADPVEAVRRADLALYRAKAEGRGRYCFFEAEMDAALKARRSLEGDLRRAVDGDEIEVIYQPVVRGTGEIVGVEALGRWRHAERGEVPPALFVPLIEELGLMAILGQRLLRRICEDTADWPRLKVSFNVSAVDIKRPNFIEELFEVFEQTGCDPRRYYVEIVEGSLLQDDAETQNVLGRLRGFGVRLSLDDFGSGFSSLSSLHRYPIQAIKLARAFVSRLHDGPDAVAIVRAIVRLAQALKLELTAEGVETREQLDLLLEMGVATFQGPLFSPPLATAELIAKLRVGQTPPIPAEA